MAGATVTTRVRLVEQFARATEDSGRYERVDRERFLRHILSGVRQHHELATSRGRMASLPVWQEEFLRSRATRQGRDAAAKFGFLLEELGPRVGGGELRADLLRSGCLLGQALARRLATTCQPGLKIAVLRARIGSGEHATLLDLPLAPTPLEQGECARQDLLDTQGDLSSISLAIAVDNTSARPANAIGIELRLQRQSILGGCFAPTGISVFGVLPRIAPGERAWVAFRGVKFAEELRADLSPSDRIEAVRVLVTRR